MDNSNNFCHKLISIDIDELNKYKKIIFNIGCKEKQLFKLFSHKINLDDCKNDLLDCENAINYIKTTENYKNWKTLVENHNPLIGQVF